MLLRVLLTIQSMMPLFLFLLLKNVSIVNNAIVLEYQNKIVIWGSLLVLGALCWISIIALNIYKQINRETVKIVAKKMEIENLNFIVSIIIPLIAEAENAFENPICFVALLVFVACCIYKTNYWYANPVLLLFGYKLYTIEYRGANENNIKTQAIVCPFSAETNFGYIKQITQDIAIMQWC